MVYPIAKKIILYTVKLWTKKIIGSKNIPNKGGFIIAANHSSYLDHFLIFSIIVPRLNQNVHFLAKKEHFDSVIQRMWHNYAEAIPVDRESGGKKGIRSAISALKKGKIIVIYPEGTRTLTGKLQKAKTGLARLALEAKVPVLPIGLIGTFEILPKGKYIPKPKKAIINIGNPMDFSRYYSKPMTKRLLRQITTKIMKEIARLSRQKYDFD